MNINIERRIHRFEEEICHNNSLEDYYGIQNNNNNNNNNNDNDNDNNNTQLKIKYTRKETNKIELKIQIEKSQHYEFMNLPEEINSLISEYCTTIIHIQLELLFPDNYPFMQPNYSFVNVKHNISNPPINIEEYYKYIIDNHNNLYKRDWSPAIHISVDILEFIQKINHFEYLL